MQQQYGFPTNYSADLAVTIGHDDDNVVI